jgi:hypothetical protein
MSTQFNMYRASAAQWNPFVGCSFGCLYCLSSFQRQLKRWAKNHCEACYRFIPHEHLERLDQPLPPTRFGQFIFTCSNADIAFCTTDYLRKIVSRIQCEKNKTFLLQSKNPQTFNRVEFPNNVVLGITLETNRDEGYDKVSKAPVPSQRYRDFLDVRHRMKMVTIEPLLDFDTDVLIEWIGDINPSLVWIGYDSRKTRLPEPPLARVQDLYWELGARGFNVALKTVRKAWGESQSSGKKAATAPFGSRRDHPLKEVLSW